MFYCCDVLYNRGRPTSLVLLLRVQVAKLSFPLGGHPSLSLHDLLCVARASRRVVSLRLVGVLEVLALALGRAVTAVLV